jgi:copper chaperone CopZ
MFELQDLPCVNQADVNLSEHTAWVNHTAMISPEDIAAKLQEAGFEASPLDV